MPALNKFLAVIFPQGITNLSNYPWMNALIGCWHLNGGSAGATMSNRNFYIAGLGASSGGQEALIEFFENFQDSKEISFVVVTHLLRDHKSILDQILSRYTKMEVRRIRNSEVVEPGIIYVMPENAKVFIRNGTLILKPRESDEIINKTVDIFFNSLAEDQQEKSIGIVFSGMGSDGAKGVNSIHKYGGIVFVQEPRSTVFRGMPDSAIKRDHPNEILPPAQLARNLLDFLETKIKAAKNSFGDLDSHLRGR
jgi:chemotaxis response regulator CheB